MWTDILYDTPWAFSFALSIFLSIGKGAILLLVLILLEKSLFSSSAKARYYIYFTGLVSLFIIFFSDVFRIAFSETPISYIPFEPSLTSISEYILHIPESNPKLFQLVSLLWTFGVLFSGLKFAFQSRQLNGIKRNISAVPSEWTIFLRELCKKININNSILLAGSKNVQVPIVMGILKPIIIIPFPLLTQFTPKELETILLHELVHIKRYDYIIKHIQSGILCFLYYNPAAWWMNKKIDQYREYSCDDEVIFHAENRMNYITALYEIAKFKVQAPQRSIALFNHKSELIMRINRMIVQKPHKLKIKSLFPLVLLGIMISTLFAFQISNGLDIQEELEEPIAKMLKQDLDIEALDIEISDETIKTATSKKLQKLQQPKTSVAVNKNARTTTMTLLDTVPDRAKIEKLEKELKIKTEELEVITSKMEQAIEKSINVDVEKLEKLAEELEVKMEPKLAEFELKMENSEAVREIEQLTKEFELKYEVKMQEMERLIDEEKMKEIELKMEALGKQMEKEMEAGEGKIDEAKMKEFQMKMQEQAMKIQKEMKGMQEIQMKLQSDPEFKAMQEKIQALSTEIALESIGHEELWDEQSKLMKEEMHKLQEVIQANMASINPQLKEEIQKKSAEIQKIAKELEKEKKKGNQ